MSTDITRRRAVCRRNPFNAPDDSALPDTDSPLRLVFEDAKVVIWNAYLMPWILWPYFIFTTDDSHELYLKSWSNIRSISRQVFLFIYAIVIIVLVGIVRFFGVFALFPPYGFALGLFVVILMMISWFVLSRPMRYRSINGARFPHESWLFVNGVATDRGWLKLNCERLAEAFGRQIVGVHNRTFGSLFDFMESIIQRDLGYTTDDVRNLYAVTKKELLDKENKRVVLIAHSQGGIIASMVVDRLLANLDRGHLKKLEVYTFASAANHMNGGHILKFIEHFANEWDFVAKTGVLAYHSFPGNKYDGEVYINPKKSGHLLNMHYLDNTEIEPGKAAPLTFAPGGGGEHSNMATYLGGNGRI